MINAPMTCLTLKETVKNLIVGRKTTIKKSFHICRSLSEETCKIIPHISNIWQELNPQLGRHELSTLTARHGAEYINLAFNFS